MFQHQKERWFIIHWILLLELFAKDRENNPSSFSSVIFQSFEYRIISPGYLFRRRNLNIWETCFIYLFTSVKLLVRNWVKAEILTINLRIKVRALLKNSWLVYEKNFDDKKTTQQSCRKKNCNKNVKNSRNMANN